jgi:hypothetical protein
LSVHVPDIKDRMTRQILAKLSDADIQIASTSYEITGIPPLRIERAPAAAAEGA